MVNLVVLQVLEDQSQFVFIIVTSADQSLSPVVDESKEMSPLFLEIGGVKHENTLGNIITK